MEVVVERYFKKKVNAAGCLCLKLKTPGYTGIPDRIVIGHKFIAFAEVKDHNKYDLSPRQRLVIATLRSFGIIVAVIRSKEDANAFVATYL